MKTVVVVGLIPRQMRIVEQQCSKACKLRFVQSQGNKPSIPSGDYCFLLIKFVRHLWTTQAFKQFPRNRVHYHMGGISELLVAIKGVLSPSAS